MKRYSKAQQIEDLVLALNEKRKRENKPAVKRCWTGAGHWLKTEEENYKSLGGIYISDDKFIGFLEGMLFTEPGETTPRMPKTQLTEKQYDSLVTKIYDTLMSAPDMGMGETGECKDEAERIVNEWMEENLIILI